MLDKSAALQTMSNKKKYFEEKELTFAAGLSAASRPCLDLNLNFSLWRFSSVVLPKVGNVYVEMFGIILREQAL